MFGPRNHTPRIGSPATESVARLAVTATAAALLAAGLTGCSTPEAADASGPRLATQPVAAEIDEAAATAVDAANTATDATGDDDDGAAAQANAGNGSRSGRAPAPTLAESAGETATADSGARYGASSGNGSRAAAEPAPGTADIAAGADGAAGADAAAERCTEAALAQSGFTGPATFLYCDGDWALAGPPNTDIIVALHWADGWRLYEGHGQTETGFTCYDPATAAADGVPEGLRAKLLTCN